MITAFRKNEITKIGKGTFVDDVYAHLTNDLHNAIRETVGQPLRNDVIAADTAWKKAMDDRDSNAGLFIYSKTNLANPMKMIDGLLDGRLSTDADIMKFYEMVGPAAKKEIQAALVARIFQRAWTIKTIGVQQGYPMSSKISHLARKARNQLEILLGDDALAESLTLKIYEISEFSKMMDKVRNVKDNLKTAFMMHGLTSIGAAVAGADSSDILKSWGIAGDVVEGAFVFGSTFAAKNGLEFAKNAFGEMLFVKALKTLSSWNVLWKVSAVRNVLRLWQTGLKTEKCVWSHIRSDGLNLKLRNRKKSQNDRDHCFPEADLERIVFSLNKWVIPILKIHVALPVL